ncbi:MAG: hypothetical protein ABIQ02_02670 [Saprospiraceae bacterium]
MRNLLAFPDESRVWVYQADRPFEDADIIHANEDIDEFCMQWTSHNKELKAIGGIMHDLFLVLVVDETKSSASGCSIDKSVAFIRNMEQKYKRRLLDRDLVAYLDDQEQLHTVALGKLKDAVERKELNMETLVFDNLVTDRKAYISGWTKPLGQSWMKKFV